MHARTGIRGAVAEGLDRVVQAIGAIVEASDPYDGLFPSLLNPRSGKMLTALPAAIHGQRDGDRCLLGNNLIHDEPLLKAMYALAEIDGRASFGDAADRYLERYAHSCVDTQSGLFGWGEHAFWHLVDGRVGSSRQALMPDARPGNATHDHLRQVPLWLWQKLDAYNPECVQRFADGLDNHWTEGEPREYIRHAYIDQTDHHPREARACDFPRHSGFYIFDLAFAHSRRPRPETLAQMEAYLEYWWAKKDEHGVLLIESRSPEDHSFHLVNAPTQTFSLGVSLLESAEFIAETDADTAERVRRYGRVYLDGFLSAPHDLENRVYVSLCLREGGEIREQMDIWGSVYGRSSVASTALLCVRAWELTEDERFLAWARTVGEAYVAEPFPVDEGTGISAIPATDPGIALDLLVDLYAATEDAKWLAGAGGLAETLLPLYFGAVIP
ncbi:hypothetical protein HN937_09870, partial [Candidatus Poribacteria bacterium]|nr:hypothetical protein [Candidatus Poribacteria bacterium]